MPKKMQKTAAAPEGARYRVKVSPFLPKIAGRNRHECCLVAKFRLSPEEALAMKRAAMTEAADDGCANLACPNPRKKEREREKRPGDGIGELRDERWEGFCEVCEKRGEEGDEELCLFCGRLTEGKRCVV